MNDFLDPQVAAYFASMQGTLAMALYECWKRGEVIRVRTKVLTPEERPLEFEIHPVRLLGSGPVMGITIKMDGKVVSDHKSMFMANNEFLEWVGRLEPIE